jgi:hypothetical protein
MPINVSVFPALSCTNFQVSGLTLRSLIHFELILVQGEKDMDLFPACRYAGFPATFVEEAVFSQS